MNLDISFISEKAKDFIRQGARSFNDYFVNISVDSNIADSVLVACDAEDDCKQVVRDEHGDVFVELTYSVRKCLLVDCDISLTNYVDDCIIMDSLKTDGDHVNYTESWAYEEDGNATLKISIGDTYIQVAQYGTRYEMEFLIKNIGPCIL